jgi:ABC-2 type transport system ATP-binding protein
VTALIEASDLTVRFGEVTALDGLTVSAPTGQVLAVLGRNGAGKSTFVRTIATLLRPDEGQLLIYGIDVRADPMGVRRDIGLAGQFAAVEPAMTGRENLQMTARLFGHSRRSAGLAAETVLEQLSLGEVADRRCGTYSGGQRRRLDLGASLVGAPRLLLLDEPTTGLDPASRREVWDAVRQLVAGGTDVLLTTHYLEEADALADQVLVIERGNVVAEGPIGDIKAGGGSDVLDLVVADPERLAAAARVLEAAADAVSRTDPTARRVSAATSEGTRALAAAVQGLDDAGIAVEEIGLRRPTLDEVFARLTDAQARSAA